MSAITEEEEENILYELLVYQEWSQDQDFLVIDDLVHISMMAQNSVLDFTISNQVNQS